MSIVRLKSLPAPVKKFLLRCLIIFIVWKLLYHLILFPFRTPDKQLTKITTTLTVELLQLSYLQKSVTVSEETYPVIKNNIFLNSKRVVGIADGCNGLELYVLYIGFLLAYSRKTKDLLLFGFYGIAIIFTLNIFRCYAITIFNIYNSSLSEVAHHYIFKLLIYGVMFMLWINYTKMKYSND